MDELSAFREECTACEQTLRGIGADDWSRPGLGEWSVAELVAHLVGGVTRVSAYLDEDVGGDEPVRDRVSYWRYDADAESAGIARRAVERAEAIPHERLPDVFSDGWRDSARRADELGPAHLLTTLMGRMRLDDYLATRVLEVVVHHVDVRRALDLPPASTPRAARLVMGVLEGLLGSPRPRNLGRDRFILAATGRIAVDDPRFPVLR
jgi:uncharacterized protein (TIGR03083 family)